MKTTLDLPDDLMTEVKSRASRDGRGVSEAVVDLLRRGLAASAEPSTPISTIVGKMDPATGLPVVVGAPDAPISRMNAEEIHALIHKTQEEEDLAGLGVSLRR